MIITCEKCAAQYEVSDNFFDKGSRKVKCDNCGYVWLQKSIKEQIYEQLLSSVSADDSLDDQQSVKKTKEQLLREHQQNPEYDEHLDEEMKNVFDDLASKVQEIDKESTEEKLEVETAPEVFESLSDSNAVEVSGVDEEALNKVLNEEISQEIPEETFEEKISEIASDIAEDIETSIEGEVEWVKEGLSSCFSKFRFACFGKIYSFIKNFDPRTYDAVSFGFMAFLSLVFATTSVFLVSKDFVVPHYPQIAFLYQKIGMKIRIPGEGIKIANLSSNQERDGEVYSMKISGDIINTTDKELKFPKLVVFLKDKENKVVGKWAPEPDRSKVDPRKTYPFELRFVNVPEEGVLTEVTVRN